MRLALFLFFAAIGLIALFLSRYAYPPPTGLASVQPPKPPGWNVRFVPLGDFPQDRLFELTNFYHVRYALSTGVLSPAPIHDAFDPSRDQVIAEALISSIRRAYPVQASEPRSVLIGFTTEDLYLKGVPAWAWAFGLRTEGHLAVISTARMGGFGPWDGRLEATRLRKMVTRYIGLLYFNLKASDDPSSAVYGPILGVADLDRMGEEY